jgi:ferric-dicitrate binding protein FerR (iron transport regulator)
MEFEDRIPKLIIGYLRNTLSASQRQELFEWVNESESNSLYFNKAIDEKLLAEKLKHFNRNDVTSRIDKTLESIDPDSKSPNKGLWVKIKKYTIAACLLLFVSSGIYYIIWSRVSTKKDFLKTTTNNNKNDVPPGTEKAVLTLADGTKVTLDNTANGTIAQQGNTVVMKEDGLLAYNTDRNKSQSGILFNTLTTPKGGEYRSLVLSDGTKVWLNSVSSIHYPTAFFGKERIVGITGEVYFEVSKNRAMPFKVNVNGMQVEVLGTHFNINAYADEATIKTTLLEGTVKIVADGKASFLKPGQQASLNANGEIKVSNDADVEEAVAWKNGIFLFKKDDIQTIMRQLARWYDVDIEFKEPVSKLFYAEIPRNSTVSTVFEALEATGSIHFKIDGKKIIVTR